MNQLKIKHLVIGFGKAGKTLAGWLAGRGEPVALVEKSSDMYGGTCINVACIPSKFLVSRAGQSQRLGGGYEARAARYRDAIQAKRQLTGMLRQKNRDKLVGAGVQLILGSASFVDAHQVQVALSDGGQMRIQAENIYVNSGSLPLLPQIEGLKDNPFVYTSETLMDKEDLPRRLVIIGGGYIGLEFASCYQGFGSQVTILQRDAAFMPREDSDIAQAVHQALTARGIQIIAQAQAEELIAGADGCRVRISTPEGKQELVADAVLVATGRRPNTQDLNLEAAGIQTDSRGGIQVDERLQSAVGHIWALGDVAGGPQFTYTSLDDFRIVRDQLRGKGQRTTLNRGAIPYSVFIDPPLSRVGLSEQEAIAQGHDVRVARLPAAAIPKAQVLEQPEGLLKAVIDKASDRLLGLHLFCAESYEMINLAKLAIDSGITAAALADAIYTHPTMTEAFNELFA